MNLDDIRIKGYDELTDEDKQFINEHKGELSEEDRFLYADYIEDDPEPETKSEDNKTPESSPTTETKPVFATPEEADAYFERKFQEKQAQLSKQDPPEPTPATPPKFVEDGKAPPSWNEFGQTIYEKAVSDAKEEFKKLRDAELTEAEKRKQAAQEALSSLHGQYDSIASKDGLPSRETPEGREMWDKLVKFGDAHNQENITKSYELWRKIPKDQGGGLDWKPESKIDAQKKAAAQLSGKSGDGSAPAPERTYKQLQSMSVDAIIEDSLR